MRSLKGAASVIAVAVSAVSMAAPAAAMDTTSESGESVTAVEVTSLSQPAIDQSESEPNSDEIIVTAQRRSESAQDVPISLSVFDEKVLARNAIDNVLDIQRIAPSFNATKASQAANVRLAIRGVGTSGNTAIEPSVAPFVDGVYIPRPGPLLATLNDIEAVEVLNGPQGTLFGRNASIGALVFRTRDAENDTYAQFSGEGGTYQRRRGNGIVNIALTDGLAFRGSVLYDEFAGFGRNDITGDRFGDLGVLSLRAGIKADLTPNLQWVVKADYQRQRGDGLTPTSVAIDTLTPAAVQNWRTRTGNQVPILDRTYTYRNRADTDGVLRDNQWGIISDLSWQLSDFTLRLISGYRDWDYFQQEDDVTNSPAAFFGREATFASKSHSQELQLVSPPDGLLDGRLSFIAGLYYYHEDYAIGENVNLGADWCTRNIGRTQPQNIAPCLAQPQQRATRYDFNQTTESFAAFSQASFKVTPELELTGGIRYTHDSKRGDLLVSRFNTFATMRAPDNVPLLELEEGRVTWRANIAYRPTPGVMFFATASTGFKSGGFDAGNGATLGAQRRIFAAETSMNYEIGTKADILDRLFTVNATLFRTDIDNFQLRAFDGNVFTIRNAGSRRSQGVEFDITARPTKGLTFSLAATRLDAEFTDFRGAPGLPAFGGVQDLTGTRPSFSPEWQGVLSGVYTDTIPGTRIGFDLGANLTFQSESDVGGAGDGNPQGIEPGYSLLGARLTVFGPDRRWEVYVTGENLTDTGFCTIRFGQVLGPALGLNDPVTGGTVQRCVLGEPLQARTGFRVLF